MSIPVVIFTVNCDHICTLVAAQSAIDAGVDVLPVALEGTGAVLPAEGFFAVRPGTIRVRFGQPIATAGEGAITQRQALARRAHDEVVALLRRRPAA